MSTQCNFTCEPTSRETRSRAARFDIPCLCCRGPRRPRYTLPKDISRLKSAKARRSKPKSKDHR